MNGQCSGPYSTVRPAKIFKLFFVAKVFRDLSPNVLKVFLASKSLKLSFTLKSCTLVSKTLNELSFILKLCTETC